MDPLLLVAVCQFASLPVSARLNTSESAEDSVYIKIPGFRMQILFFRTVGLEPGNLYF